jgi:hypothetical protein
MKGLFPWLREALFGPPTQRCTESYCGGRSDPRCPGLNCTSHCKMYCYGTQAHSVEMLAEQVEKEIDALYARRKK